MADSALGATVFEMAFQTWMAELVPEESAGTSGPRPHCARGRLSCSFRSMSIEYNADFLFDYVYTHLARIADFVAREEGGEKSGRS
jgi:hypothetical protein